MDSFVREPKVIFECRNPEHETIESVTLSYGVMRFCADESCRLVIKSKRRKRRFKFCTYCQKYGHTHWDCFAKRRAKKSYQRTYLQCRKCDQFGHAHHECPYYHEIMLFLAQLMMPTQSQPFFPQQSYESESSWRNTDSSWRKPCPPSNEKVKANPAPTTILKTDIAAKSPKKPFPSPILSSCNHCFQKFLSRNKLFMHLKSDCTLARDDPQTDSAIQTTDLPK